MQANSIEALAGRCQSTIVWGFTVAEQRLSLACSSSPSGSNAADVYSMRATIAGRIWRATPSSIKADVCTAGLPGRLNFVGGGPDSDEGEVTIALSYISGPGTYPMGVGWDAVRGGWMRYRNNRGVFWTTPMTGASGTVTVKTLAADRITGTFAARLTNAFDQRQADTVQVTNGNFDVPLNSGFTLPVGDDTGSVFITTFNSNSWMAARVSGMGGGTTTIDVEASTDSRLVRVHLEGIDGVGVYQISAVDSPIR